MLAILMLKITIRCNATLQIKVYQMEIILQ